MKKKGYFVHLIFIIILQVIFTTNALSQFGNTTSGPAKQVKPEKAKMISDRTLLVVKTDVPDFDKKIQEIVSKYWKLDKDIQYISSENLNSKIAGKETQFCVLSVDEVTISERSGAFTYSNKYIRFSLKLGEELKKKKAFFYSNIAYKVDRTLLEKGAKTEQVFNLDKKEILFAIDIIQNHLYARLAGKNRLTFAFEVLENSGKLATKTLLINKEQMDKNLTEEDIKKLYPYKYKIVTEKDIENAYLSRNKDYAYVEIAPLGYSRGVMTHYIVDCENGQILSFGEQYNGLFDKYSNLISKDHLKAYVKNSNRKR